MAELSCCNWEENMQNISENEQSKGENVCYESRQKRST